MRNARQLRAPLLPSGLLLAAALISACAAPGACGGERAELPSAPVFAVVRSDYFATAITLLDGEGALLDASWISSSSAEPGLVAALSGDVVLPRTPFPSELALVDRYQTDVLTITALAPGARPVQLDLRGPRRPDGARRGESPNPHDALPLSDHEALVTRFAPTRDASAPELARGDDVIVVDRDRAPEAVVARIAMPGGVAFDGTTPTLARPSAMVRVRAGDASRVLVTLGRLDASFLHIGEGAIAVIDPDARELVGTLALAELGNCLDIAVAPDDDAVAHVGCAGDTFVQYESERAAHAGLVSLRLSSDGEVSIEHVLRAVEHPEIPSPTEGLVALSSTTVLVPSRGEPGDGTTDRLMLVDLAAATHRVVYEADGVFVLGRGAHHASSALILIPDARRSELLRLRWTGAEIVDEGAMRVASTCERLPPRQVGLVSP